MGGPDPLLSVDGQCGPKTIAAIHRFQRARLGFSDGRVDPGGKTLASLNLWRGPDLPRSGPIPVGHAGFVADNPVANPMAALLKMYLDIIPTVRAAIMSARRRLANVEPFISTAGVAAPTQPGLDRERHNLALLDDCFGLSQFADPSSPYRKIKDVFDSMSVAIARCQPGPDPLANGLIALNPVPELDDFPHETAYVATTGFHEPFETVPLQGHQIRSDQIYITRNATVFTVHRPSMICLLIHELAHWVSRPADPVRDRAVGHVFWDDSPFRQLLPTDQITNAENYGWFGTRSYLEPFAY